MFTGTDGVHYETGIPPSLVRPELVTAMKEEAHRVFPPVFAGVIARMEGMFMQAIYDLESDLMGRGRVAIIGDAAFVARPHCGAGVSKAADDAASLANALSTQRSHRRRHRHFSAERTKAGKQRSSGPRTWIIFPDGQDGPSTRQTFHPIVPQSARSTLSNTRVLSFRRFANSEAADSAPFASRYASGVLLQHLDDLPLR